MNNKKSSIDGFVPRRPGSQVGERHVLNASSPAPRRKQLRSEADLQNSAIGQPRNGKVIGRSDIDDSLRQLDEGDGRQQRGRKMSRRDKRRMKKDNRTNAQKMRKRIIVGVVLLIAAGLLAAGGYLAFKAFNATGHVLNGSFADLIQNAPLKEDANGRSNFLLLGTSEDDPGHEAGYLTDSIMVLSINQKTKDAYMFSIPRDLYVDYGQYCMPGSRGKINVYFSCMNDGTDDAAEQDRLAKTQAFMGEITGLDIQYGVHVNYTVMRDVVNAIGGSIQVKIEGDEGNGPQPDIGIMDANFDWKCGATLAKRKATCPPDGHFIDFEPGIQTLDAEHALYLAQARGDAANVGLAQSNFDRERNQQKILVAIRDKAMSAGTLTNLGAITGLIDALGNNLRTNVQTKEVRTLMSLAQDIKSENIKSLDFYNKDNLIFTTGTLPGAGSSVYPSAGVNDYSELQAYIKKQISSEPFMKEDPHLTVLNGSGEVGVAQLASDSLTEKGFTVDMVDNAPDGTYDKVEIYQINSEKKASAAKLAQIYGVQVKTSTPPATVTGETDFLIIIGDASVVR